MKICFVIMGFGKKTDYASGRTIDLDKTYQNIIRPAVEESGFRCIRADEIQDSGLIDKSMYALLVHSDLVIADISTYNPNALYELGIRHGVRPYATIIMKEEQGKIPFDIDHNRLFMYKHLGEDIGKSEAERCQERLKSIIKSVMVIQAVDSPLYEFFSNLIHPEISKEEFDLVIEELADDEKAIFAIISKADKLKKEGKFEEAFKLWTKASEKSPNEQYFVQQAALCKYKSKSPSELTALNDALGIIGKLDDSKNDPETLGIAGAINKSIFRLTEDVEFLDRAIEHYGKGFQIRNDYYTGENYALCLNLRGKTENSEDDQVYYRIQAKKVRESIVEMLQELLDTDEVDEREDKRWIYATLANCYFALDNTDNYQAFREKFYSETTVQWELDTFENSINILKDLLGGR